MTEALPRMPDKSAGFRIHFFLIPFFIQYSFGATPRWKSEGHLVADKRIPVRNPIDACLAL